MFVVDRSNRESEFDTQAALYQGLAGLGYRVRGEVRGKCSESGKPVRLDLVVFADDGSPLAALEVKVSRRQAWKRMYMLHPQMRIYARLGLPVVFVCGLKEAALFLETPAVWLQKPPGAHWLVPPT